MATTKPTRTAEETSAEELPPIHEMTAAEFRAVFDAQVRETLGMSGEEFVRSWEAGEIKDWDPEAAHLVMMLPFLEE